MRVDKIVCFGLLVVFVFWYLILYLHTIRITLKSGKGMLIIRSNSF